MRLSPPCLDEMRPLKVIVFQCCTALLSIEVMGGRETIVSTQQETVLCNKQTAKQTQLI